MKVATDENVIIISGTIGEDVVFDHQLYGEEFFTTTLMVPRLSGTIDYIPITIPSRILTSFPLEGDRVGIIGQVRSYNRHTQDGSRLCVTVFAKEIYPVESGETPENRVVLTGYLCKPVVFRTTPFMREIGDMLIAPNRSFNKSDYLPCIAWGRNAHRASEIPVGSRIRAEGRLQSRRYQKVLSDGTVQDRTAYEISCSSIEML